MTSQQLAILNSLVTYAAENVPGGLSPEEQEVARIVGAAALLTRIEDVQEPKAQIHNLFRYTPVFAGRTEGGEKVVIYKSEHNGWQLFLRRDDGEVHAVGPEWEVTRWEVDEKTHVEITSPQWCGKAIGTKAELIEEDRI